MHSRIHIPSLLTGFFLFALLGAAATGGAMQIGIRGADHIPTKPRARDMVQIVEGQPYVIPPGKRLVITAIGNSEHSVGGMRLLVDGVQALHAGLHHEYGAVSMKPIPPGFSVIAGSIVEPDFGGPNNPGGIYQAWGYLEQE